MKSKLGLAIAGFMLINPAHADDWFQHKFGELRAYHGDWLNVCKDEGKGDCRTVQTPLKSGDDPFFGESQLTVHASPDGTYQIEIFARNMVIESDMHVGFCFDNDFCSGSGGPEAWRPGAKDFENVAETILITDAEVSKIQVERMIKHNLIEIEHGPGNSFVRSKFSLRGITAALNAIKKHYAERKAQ